MWILCIYVCILACMYILCLCDMCVCTPIGRKGNLSLQCYNTVDKFKLFSTITLDTFTNLLKRLCFPHWKNSNKPFHKPFHSSLKLIEPFKNNLVPYIELHNNFFIYSRIAKFWHCPIQLLFLCVFMFAYAYNNEHAQTCSRIHAPHLQTALTLHLSRWFLG